MKTTLAPQQKTTVFSLVCASFIGLFSACETTSGGGTTSTYEASVYDPRYYGGSYDDPAFVTVPPNSGGPRPSHPIAMPPSMPRPSPRR